MHQPAVQCSVRLFIVYWGSNALQLFAIKHLQLMHMMSATSLKPIFSKLIEEGSSDCGLTTEENGDVITSTHYERMLRPMDNYIWIHLLMCEGVCSTIHNGDWTLYTSITPNSDDNLFLRHLGPPIRIMEKHILFPFAW